MSIATPFAAATETTSNAEQLASIEKQLTAVERQVDAYYFAFKDFEKGVKDFESNPSLKRATCAGISGVLPKTLEKYRANAASLEHRRQDMSEGQKVRLTSSQELLAKATAVTPGCAGI